MSSFDGSDKIIEVVYLLLTAVQIIHKVAPTQPEVLLQIVASAGFIQPLSYRDLILAESDVG
jgi:hypothetical protein